MATATPVVVAGPSGQRLYGGKFPAGWSTLSGSAALGDVAASGGLASVVPVVLAFDAQTPEQISIRAPLTRAVASGTTVLAEYKLVGSGTWLSAGNLFKVDSTTLPVGAPGGIVDAFAGCIFGLAPGTTYDVRLTITEPGQGTVAVAGTRATRALPGAAPAPNKTATPATLAAQLATLVPGDCLELAAGTYAAFTLAEGHSGSAGSPIYVRGASRTGVIVSVPTGVAVTWAASHLVLENMTLQGSGSDSGTSASSACIVFATGLGTPQTNATIRNITATGFDRFCKAFEPVNGRLVYNCTITGNNTWAMTYGSPVNLTWNDDGVSGPGSGNCFFDSAITGHGDALKVESSSGVYYSAAIFMYRVACDRTGDDFAEFDDATGNCAAYDCAVKNAGTGLSVDGINGGPIYFFRNRVGNTTRGPVKPTSESQNVALLSNTFLRTANTTGFGFYAAASSANRGWVVKNNALIYRGSSDVIRLDCSLPTLDWDYNAIYPAAGVNITLGAGRGPHTGLTTAKAALAPLMAHDVAAVSNPFAATITLGADHTTEYTGSMAWALGAGVSLLNAGVALPGITDGFSGAAPDIGAVIAGRAVAAAGDGSVVPAWIQSQVLNTWGVIPASNTLDSLNPDTAILTGSTRVNPNHPSLAPWRAAGSHAAIVTAWCGAVSIPSEARLAWFNPGGHNDGYPAAAYDLVLGQETPIYRRLCTPSGAADRAAMDYAAEFGSIRQIDGQGRHRAQHTESFQVNWPGKGIATLSGILLANTGGSAATCRPYVSNKDTGEIVGGLGADMGGALKGNGSFAGACYDTSRGVAWMKAAGTNSRMAHWGGPDSDVWTQVGTLDPFLSGGVTLAYCPTLDLILVGNGDNSGAGSGFVNQTIVGGWGLFDPATGTWFAQGLTGTYPTFSGAPALNVEWANGLCPGLCQPQWEPVLGAFLAWDNRTGTTQVMRITPPVSGDPRTGAWVVDYLPVSGSNAVAPSASAPNGTYGRFAVYPELGICVVVNSVSEAGYFFKYKDV